MFHGRVTGHFMCEVLSATLPTNTPQKMTLVLNANKWSVISWEHSYGTLHDDVDQLPT